MRQKFLQLQAQHRAHKVTFCNMTNFANKSWENNCSSRFVASSHPVVVYQIINTNCIPILKIVHICFIPDQWESIVGIGMVIDFSVK